MLVGDFLQLPPVPSIGDAGQWLYDADCFVAANFHIHRLSIIHRQSDSAYIR